MLNSKDQSACLSLLLNTQLPGHFCSYWSIFRSTCFSRWRFILSFFSRKHRRTALHTLSTLLFFFASVLQILLTVGAVKETLFDASCQGNSAEPSETLYARVFLLFSEVWNQCTGALSSKFWSITILVLRLKFLCSKLAPFFISMRGGSSIAFRL